MKRLDEIARKIAPTPDSNGQISQTDRPAEPSPAPMNIVCFDRDNPDQPCSICQGMGVVKYDVPVDDQRFGKIYRCPNHPVEADFERQHRMRRMSNLDAFSDRVFENFEIEIPGYTPREIQSLRLAFNTARSFAANLDGWLLLEGSYGTGKTHLAAAIGNVRLNRGDQVLFITTPDLLDHLRSTFSPNSETGYDEMFERVRNAGLLILDDLGVENPSEWAKEKLFQLLNHRYTRRMPTVITTNVDLDTLDPRIRSRLMDLNVIHRVSVVVPDYRNATPNQRDQLLSRLPMYEHMTFETFDVQHKVAPDEQQKLTHAARGAYQYAQQPENWLLFTGDFGSGKTHLAAAIANYRRNVHKEDVLFLTVPDLLDYLRTTFAPDSPVTFDKLFDQVRNVPLLVLDDLGTESAKSWAQEKLFQILDYRYVGQMPTVITMAKEMTEISPRIASRLIDPRICRVVEIRVQGYALRMRRKP